MLHSAMCCSSALLLLAIYVTEVSAFHIRRAINIGDGFGYVGNVLTKDEVMANMTNDVAVAEFMDMQPQQELVSLLEGHLGKGLVQFAHQRSQAVSHLASLETQEPNATGYTGVERAREMLNSMIVETRRKLDIETVTGIDFEERQLGLLSELRGHISQANADAAQARGIVLDAEAKILEYEKKLPKLKEEQQAEAGTCDRDITTLTVQLGIVKEDLEVMHIILNMTQCPEDGAEENISFVSCHTCKGGKVDKTSMGLQHLGLSTALKRLKSPQARHAVQQNLAEFLHEVSAEPTKGQKHLPSGNRSTNTTALTTFHAEVAPVKKDQRILQHAKGNTFLMQDEAVSLDMSDIYLFNDSSPESENLGDLKTDPQNPLNTSDVPKETVRSDCAEMGGGGGPKCSISTSPQCQLLQDRFMQITGNMMDMRDELEEKLDMRKAFCEESTMMYKDQINEMEEKHNSELARHAQGTKQQVDSERASHEYDLQHHDTEKDYYKKMKANCATKNQLTSEICALEKIRGELMRLKGLAAHVVDCEVGKWIHEPCTATCGGGKQRSTRTVTVQPNLGAECPALAMQQDCGMAPCPIDCVVDDWSGWSECSAQCGGGVMTRQRQIKVEQKHDGEPCGDTMQSVTCNIQACNQDCTLSDWTDWGTCSKACFGGVQTRYKKITKSATGSGVCAPAQSTNRMQYQPCNGFDCARLSNRSDGRITCKSKIDVVIMMDSSVSLRKDGWQRSKELAKQLIEAMPGGKDGANVAFLIFSGPSGDKNFNACLYGSATNVERQCGIKWVSRFTNDTAALAAKVDNLKWIRKTTLTSLALTMVREELKYGRKDANSAVVVITDGRPMRAKVTGEESRMLQKEAQVSWVLVGRMAPKMKYVREHGWTSRPLANNLLKVASDEELNEMSTVNKIVSNICPVVS